MTKLRKASTLLINLIIVSVLMVGSSFAQDGQALFNANCASCHKMDADLVGPALEGMSDRWPSKELLHTWIKNWNTAVETGDAYAAKMAAWSPAAMNTFPNLSDAEIDAIIEYVNTWQPPAAAPAAGAGAGAVVKKEGNNSMLYGLITLALAIVALVLLGVNRNLRKLADDKQGLPVYKDVPAWKNKTYLALVSIALFIFAGVFISKGAIDLGRSKDYTPVQPIFYSHKVHAGINQINCQYCHTGVAKGKQATLPSINVCMNCHLAITTYTGEQLYDERGNPVDGTAEIEKLFELAGYSKGSPWDPSQAKGVEWIRIHNLPDHVYFNHSQHVVAGKVACQTCHGEIQNMDEVGQFADLSMGWCVNCHRETKVQFTENGFYSIYEKFHEDMKSGKLDSVTVEMVGGTECQKCHY